METTMFLLHIINQINFKWAENLSFQGKALKLLEENIKECIHNLLIRRIYLKESTKHQGNIR